LVGTWHADVFVWHGLHHFVHGLAQVGRGGQLSHHERRARVCLGVGLGLARSIDRTHSIGRRLFGGRHSDVAGFAQTLVKALFQAKGRVINQVLRNTRDVAGHFHGGFQRQLGQQQLQGAQAVGI